MRAACPSAGWARSAPSKSERASSARPAARAAAARSQSSPARGSPAEVRQDSIERSERRSAKRDESIRSSDVIGGAERGEGGGAAPDLAGGHPLFFFGQTLAVDAVPGERDRVEPLLRDELAAPLAEIGRAS